MLDAIPNEYENRILKTIFLLLEYVQLFNLEKNVVGGKKCSHVISQILRAQWVLWVL